MYSEESIMNTYTPLSDEEIISNNDARKYAKGIMQHEFDQSIIDVCEPIIEECQKLIAQGVLAKEDAETYLFLELKKKFNID